MWRFVEFADGCHDIDQSHCSLLVDHISSYLSIVFPDDPKFEYLVNAVNYEISSSFQIKEIVGVESNQYVTVSGYRTFWESSQFFSPSEIEETEIEEPKIVSYSNGDLSIFAENSEKSCWKVVRFIEEAVTIVCVSINRTFVSCVCQSIKECMREVSNTKQVLGAIGKAVSDSWVVRVISGV